MYTVVCAIQGPVYVIQGTCVIYFVTVDCAGWSHGKHVAECVCRELSNIEVALSVLNTVLVIVVHGHVIIHAPEYI